MKRKMRTAVLLLFCAITVTLWLPIPANADSAPKPSVEITFENLGDEPCYATLLSSEPHYIRWNVWEEGEEPEYFGLDPAVWQAFADYEDPDGYYFLQYAQPVGETKTYVWSYYPPETFKLLLYFPETETFLVSGSYRKYAYDSLYTVDLSARDDGGALVLAETGKDPSAEDLLFFGVRVVLTIVIEMAVAIAFGFRRRGQLIFLAILNIFTQVLLNLILMAVGTGGGSFVILTQMLVCFFLEIVVFFIEAVADATILRRLSNPRKPWYFYVFYALVANAASFLAGETLVFLLPVIF